MSNVLEQIEYMLNDKIQFHSKTTRLRVDYSKDYAHKALVKNRHGNDHIRQSHERESMWHDGNGEGHDSAVHTLKEILNYVKSQKIQ